MTKPVYGDYCVATTWSGTAGIVVAGNPSIRFAGFQVDSLTSAGAGVVDINETSATGANVYYNTAGAAKARDMLGIPIRVGNIYAAAASGSLTGFACTMFFIKD